MPISNMRNCNITVVLTSVTAWVTPVCAQQVTSTPPVTLVENVQGIEPAENEQSTGDIIVTAQKRSESLRNVPMSITAISGDQMQRRGISDVASLAKITPGFSYVETGQSVPVYSLRGVGFFDTSLGARPTVSVYLDQMPLTFSIMAAGAAMDLERVEVLKGPQGTLFGGNATGGAINYIAAKPKSTFGAGMNGSYSRFGTIDAQSYVTGPLSGTLNVRLATRIVRGDAWQRSYTRNDKLGKQKLLQGRFIADWTPTSEVRFELNANGYVDHSDTQAGQLVAIVYSRPTAASSYPLLGTYPLPPKNNQAADWDPGRKFSRNNSFYQLGLRSEVDLTDGITLTSLTSFARAKIDQVTDVDALAITNDTNSTRGVVKSLNEELRIGGRAGIAQWIIGANYAREESFEDGLSEYLYATSTASFASFEGKWDRAFATGRQTFDNKAVFGNVDLDVGTKIVLHGGIRYTRTKLDYSSCSRAGDASTGLVVTNFVNSLRRNVGLGPIPLIAAGQCLSIGLDLTSGALAGQFNESNASWRAGADWKPVKGVLVYANASKGYKSGNSPVLNALTQAQLRPVAQESVLAYEVGLKANIIPRILEASGAGFYYDYRDKQVKGRSIATPNVLGVSELVVNIPKSRIWGVEGQISLFPTEGLSVTGGGTYIDSQVQSSFPNFSILGTPANFKGEAFPYTPKFQAVGDVAYEHSLSSSLTGTWGASYSYRTKTVAGFGVSDVLSINAYGLLDLRAGVKDADNRWRVELFGRNVTNAYYWTNVGRVFDVARRLTGRPATYGISFGYTL